MHSSEIKLLTKDQTTTLLDRIDELSDYLEEIVLIGQKPSLNPANASIYLNEVLIGDNTVIVKSGDKLTAYMSQNITSSVVTDDVAFCKHSLETFENISRKSTLISGTSEKNRTKFFGELRAEIGTCRESLRL